LEIYIMKKLRTAKQVLERMNAGARLVHMHSNKPGPHWGLVPGGPVADAVAAEITKHPHVVGQSDGLFPGHDQTWRLPGGSWS
jgi:hypothetical protein